MDKTKDSTFDKIKYQNSYNRKHYDSVNIAVPAGMRDQIKEYAKAENLSVTKYILKTIEFYEKGKEF